MKGSEYALDCSKRIQVVVFTGLLLSMMLVSNHTHAQELPLAGLPIQVLRECIIFPGQKDYQHCDFIGKNFEGQDLSEANFTGAAFTK